MRKHPTPATVLAALALFVSMSGTAAAAVIISSNRQVAAHTIAGANAPSGDNQNLINGSVGSSDLHNSAITGTKVENGSLTGADLANGSLDYRKLKLPKLDWSGPHSDANDGKPHHTALNLDGVTLGVSCVYLSQKAVTELQAFLTSTNANASARISVVSGISASGAINSSLVEGAVSPTPTLFAYIDSSSTRTLLSGQLIYHDADRVIAFTLDGSADGLHDSCDLQGVAVPAPN